MLKWKNKYIPEFTKLSVHGVVHKIHPTKYRMISILSDTYLFPIIKYVDCLLAKYFDRHDREVSDRLVRKDVERLRGHHNFTTELTLRTKAKVSISN